MSRISIAASAPQRLKWQFPWLFIAAYGVALYFGIV